MCVHRAEVVGSLLRPRYLAEARAALEAGALGADQYKWLEDRAVDQAIALQEGAGLDVVTDGEMRRFTFFDQLVTAIEGLGEVAAKPVPFHADDGDDIDFQSPEWSWASCGASACSRRRSTPTRGRARPSRSRSRCPAR